MVPFLLEQKSAGQQRVESNAAQMQNKEQMKKTVSLTE